MNDIIPPDRASDLPRANSDHPARLSGLSMPPDGEGAAPAVIGMLNHAVQGAHDAIDRAADRAVPAVRQLGERASATGEAIQATTDQLRDTRDEWVERVRTRVRGNPLATMVAAVVLGAVIARIAR